MCKVASELGITVDSEKSQEVQYQSVSDPNLRLTFEKVDIVVFAVHDTLVDTEVVVFEIKVADVAADLKRVGLRAS
jgi:hypothetical protein